MLRRRAVIGTGAVNGCAATVDRAEFGTVGRVRIGHVSSAALMVSGVAGVVAPQRVAQALELTVNSARGSAEVRAGLGGTYAALGGWALVSPEPAAEIAVGATWLGAAAVRLASLVVDRSPVSFTPLRFWSR